MYGNPSSTLETMRLLTACFAVLQLAQEGKIFSAVRNDIDESITALDNMEIAMEGVLKALPKTTSAFLRHRTEIMADGFAGERLRELVLAMGNDVESSININALLQQLDSQHTNIVLELIDQFASTGNRDMHFVDLLNLIPGQAS